MTKKKKPQKTNTINNCKTFYFGEHTTFYDKTVPLEVFLDWIKETLPSKAIKPTIQINEQWETGYGEGFYIGSDLLLSWQETVKNEKYEKQMKKWKKENK